MLVIKIRFWGICYDVPDKETLYELNKFLVIQSNQATIF